MFQQGYFVKVTNNLEQLMELQAGHGEWVDNMNQVGLLLVLLLLVFFFVGVVFVVGVCVPSTLKQGDERYNLTTSNI